MYTHSQTLLDVFDKLLERSVKLQFLQVVAPGQVYPPRGGGRGLVSPTSETNPLCDAGTSSKKFRMQDLGLAWETVETLHFFMYPGRCGWVWLGIAEREREVYVCIFRGS